MFVAVAVVSSTALQGHRRHPQLGGARAVELNGEEHDEELNGGPSRGRRSRARRAAARARDAGLGTGT